MLSDFFIFVGMMTLLGCFLFLITVVYERIFKGQKVMPAERAMYYVNTSDEWLVDDKLLEIDTEIIHASRHGFTCIQVTISPYIQERVIGVLKSLGYRVSKLDPNQEIYTIAWGD